MKPAYFHCIRTPSFVRRRNGGPSPQISPAGGWQIHPCPKITPTTITPSPTHSAASVPTADNSRSAFTLHFLSTTTHTHTQRNVYASAGCEHLTVKPQIQCMYYHKLTRESLCSIYLLACLFSIAVILARASYINPKALSTATTCQNFQP